MRNIFSFLIASILLASCASKEGLVTTSSNGKYDITTIGIRGAAYSTPIATENDLVVLGTHKKSIYFLSKDSIHSVFRTKLWVHATPAIVYDSLIALGSYDGTMYFFNTNGDLQKRLRKCGRIYTNPEQINEQWIAFATGFKGLWYYNITNDSLFLAKTKRLTHGSPTAFGNRQICVGSNSKTMYFFDAAGNKTATFKAKGWIMHSKALPLSDSVVVFGSYDNNLYSVSSSGNLQWSFATRGKIHDSPQQFANGNIIFGAFDNSIYIVTPDGQKVAEIPTQNRVVSSAAIDGNLAYIGSYDTNLYIVDQNGVVEDTICLGGKIFSSPIILSDGTIFCATTNGKAVFVSRKK